MKLFVTGGTGFIGSHFINAAHAAGHEILALRRSAGSVPRVPLIRQPTWLEGGLSDVTSDHLAGCEVLVHLAAGGVTPQPATWELCYRVNVTESLALAECALASGIRRIVVTGSYAEYGKAGLRFDPIPPDAPLEPTDPYAASKASSSIALAALCRARKFELAYYRLFSVFGEGQYEKNFWPQLRAAALAGADFPMTSGEQVRDFVSVDETVRLLVEAVVREDIVSGEPWVRNLASGRPVTLRAFAEEWWARFEADGDLKIGKIPNRPNEVMRYVPLV